MEVTVIDSTASAIGNSAESIKMAAAAAAVGYSLPADASVATLVWRIKDDARHTLESLVTLGQGLYVLRETVPHGEWNNALADLELGISPAQASRMINLAEKYAQSRQMRVLFDAAGSKSKAFELLSLNDDSAAEIEPADVEAMNTKELRAEVQRANAAAADAEQALVAARETFGRRVRELERAAEGKPAAPAYTAEQASGARKHLLHGCDEIERILKGLAQSVAIVAGAEHGDSIGEAERHLVEHRLMQVQALLDGAAAAL